MSNGSTVAVGLFIISSFLSITWGIYLFGTVIAYVRTRNYRDRRKQDMVVALRRFIVAFCIWLVCFSFVFRTVVVLLGMGDELAGQIVFYALLGTNVVGSIFAAISLRYD